MSMNSGKIFIFIVFIAYFHSCNPLTHSATEEFLITDFSQPIEKKIKFHIDSLVKKKQKDEPINGVYKARLCVTGSVDGVVSIIQFGNTYKVRDMVDECYVHDHYDNMYALDIFAENKQTKGELNFKITIYY